MYGGGLGNAFVDSGATLNILDGGGSCAFYGRCTNNGSLHWMRSAAFGDFGGALINRNVFLMETNCDFTVWVDGEFLNAGLINLTHGLLSVAGPFVPTSTGTIRFSISGTQPGPDYGQLMLGDLMPAGAVEVTLSNGFSPGQQSRFPLITYSHCVGGFPVQSLPALPPPLRWQLDYTPTQLLLGVESSLHLANPVRLEDGSFQLTLTGTAGYTNVIATSTNLLDWTPVGTNSLVDGMEIFIDSNASQFPCRFYRVQ